MCLNGWHLAAGLAVVAVVGFVAPTASADGQVPLGGGAGIAVNGTHCTLTTIGHDSSGQLVGITAAHCGGPGSQVAVEGSGAVVGSVAAADDGLDYAVIKFDPAKVTPTANFAGFAINGIGADPDWHQDACTNGAANGIRCGGISSIPGPGPRCGMGPAPFLPGDDGSPVTSNDRLIGLVYGGIDTPGDLQGTPRTISRN